jgi:hypothetical protein
MNLYRMALIILALPIMIAAGCEQKYRYPCQDAKNWETEHCQKPRCEIHRDCPSHIFNENEELNESKD